MKMTRFGWSSIALMLIGTRGANAGTLPPPLLAQVAGNLHNAFEAGLGVLFLAGFLWGVLKIWGGAHMMSKGDVDGKMGIVSGIIIAGAASIMAALFAIFGMQAGALTPQF